MLQSSQLLAASYTAEISGSLACPCDTLAIANSCFQATFDVLILAYPIPIFRKMKIDRKTRSECNMKHQSSNHVLTYASSWTNRCILPWLIHACYTSYSSWRGYPLYVARQPRGKAARLFGFLRLGNRRGQYCSYLCQFTRTIRSA